VRSGRYDFGDQPALLAVAQAISANDQDAIRAAAKAVPDLQAPGRDWTALLCSAVRETWQRPQLVESVKTLLSLGADPNYTNGHRDSFALANAVHGSARLLQSMLDAGGNPNARDELGRPIILMNWYLGYYENDQRARLDLLLDRGADINSTMPESESEFAGYTLLLYRTEMGPRYSDAYADALHLLERGADPNRVARGIGVHRKPRTAVRENQSQRPDRRRRQTPEEGNRPGGAARSCKPARERGKAPPPRCPRSSAEPKQTQMRRPPIPLH